MKKIISLFQRNYDGDYLVRDEVVPGAEWVIEGQGIATRKFDGQGCMVRGGKLFKRYHTNEGPPLPPGFELVERKQQKDKKGRDIVKIYGWLPVADGPEDRWFKEGFYYALTQYSGRIPDGTYELIGPNVQGNPEHWSNNALVHHGIELFPDCPRTFSELREWFKNKDIEGIVWHHPDGRMVKIKKKDFGLKRKE